MELFLNPPSILCQDFKVITEKRKYVPHSELTMFAFAWTSRPWPFPAITMNHDRHTAGLISTSITAGWCLWYNLFGQLSGPHYSGSLDVPFRPFRRPPVDWANGMEILDTPKYYAVFRYCSSVNGYNFINQSLCNKVVTVYENIVKTIFSNTVWPQRFYQPQSTYYYTVVW